MKVLIEAYDAEYEEIICITKSGKGTEVRVDPACVHGDEVLKQVGKVFKLKNSSYMYENRGYTIYVPTLLQWYELADKSVPDVIDAMFTEVATEGVA